MTYFYLICLKGAVGVVIHEIGHAIGFFHEQSRPDRDNYVTIHYENIVKEMEFNFKKHSEKELTTNNIPYETASIMHYGSHVSKSMFIMKCKANQNNYNNKNITKPFQNGSFSYWPRVPNSEPSPTHCWCTHITFSHASLM